MVETGPLIGSADWTDNIVQAPVVAPGPQALPNINDQAFKNVLYDAIITSRQVSYATQRVQVSWSEVHARVSEPYPGYTKNQLKDRANTMRRGRHLMNWDVIRSDD